MIKIIKKLKIYYKMNKVKLFNKDKSKNESIN